MTSNYPRFSGLVVPMYVGDALNEISRFSTHPKLEENVMVMFVCSVQVVKHMGIENKSSLSISDLLFSLSNGSGTKLMDMAGNLDLSHALFSMFGSAVALAGPLADISLQLSNPARTCIEKAFISVVALVRKQETNRQERLASEVSVKKELANASFEFYLLLKSAFEDLAECEVRIAADEAQDVIEYVINLPFRKQSFDRAFDKAFVVLNILIGFIAAEMVRAVRRKRDAATLADMDKIYPPKSFCFDLYLYMGYRYHIISKEDYQRVRSQVLTNHFTNKVGKAVILLGHAYRPKITENLIGIMSYLKMDLKTCNSLYYITRFVRDSIQAYPNSSYRYMVILCLISEITLALYHEKENVDPLKDYVDEACRYYNESGMQRYEAMLRDRDNFQGFANHAKLLDKAWTTVSLVAIHDVVLKYSTTRDLMARYGDRLEGYSSELVSSRTGPGDNDSDKDSLERLLLDDEDVSVPIYEKCSDYLGSGRKSSLPKAEQPELANVEGKSNPEGQNGASSTIGRKGPADFEGKSNPEDQKGASSTKGRKGPADFGGKSNPEDQKGASSTKGRKGPADFEGKSNHEDQKGASSTKGRKGPADFEGKSNLEGQKDPSPTKGRKRSFPKAGKSSSRENLGLSQGSWNVIPLSLTSGGQALATVRLTLPMVPTGQKGGSSTQSPLHPSGEVKSSPGKAGKSSPGVQPKSTDDGESNTETIEDVPPRQGASKPKPKKKSKKSKGRR